MRNSEVTDEVGYFWLPGTPDSKVPGTLHISERGKVTLDLMGMLGNPNDVFKSNTSFKRIIGLIKAQYVTLDACICTQNTISFGGISKSTINASVAYLGVAYEEDEKINFSKVEFSVEGLDEWLLLTGLEVRHNSQDASASIRYKAPEKITLKLPDDVELAFEFSWSVSGGGTQFKEANINQNSFISLISKTSLSLEVFLTIIVKLTNFLCFAIDKTVMLKFITGFSPDVTRKREGADNEEVPIHIYFESVSYEESIPKIYWQDMLFRYDHVKDRLVTMKHPNQHLTSISRINLALKDT
jgi:hypothetical protein